MHCEVLRPFQATNEALLETGQIVDTTGWREDSVLRLINQRYLRQVLEPQPLSGPITNSGAIPEIAPESDEAPGMSGKLVSILLEADSLPGTVVAAKPATVMDALGRFPKSHRDKR